VILSGVIAEARFPSIGASDDREIVVTDQALKPSQFMAALVVDLVVKIDVGANVVERNQVGSGVDEESKGLALGTETNAFAGLIAARVA
jgi:hypothetical protein